MDERGPWSFAKATLFVGTYLHYVLGMAVLCATVVVVYLLVAPRAFTSRAVFLPTGGEDVSGGVARLAAQFGVAFAGGGSGEAPQFYAEFVESWPVLNAVASTRYEVAQWYHWLPWQGREHASGDIAHLLGIEGSTPARQREKVVLALRSAVTARVNRESGTVEVSVQMPWADLAHQVVTRILGAVDSFNIRIRHSQASAEREFIALRLAESEDSLRRAETELERFLTMNRDFRNSPQLTFAFGRLERRVVERQNVVTMLRQALEQARIEEVRSTPVITVVEPPRVRALPDRRYLILRALFAGIIGSVIGIGMALIRAASRSAELRDDPEFRMLHTAIQRAWGHVARIGRPRD